MATGAVYYKQQTRLREYVPQCIAPAQPALQRPVEPADLLFTLLAILAWNPQPCTGQVLGMMVGCAPLFSLAGACAFLAALRSACHVQHTFLMQITLSVHSVLRLTELQTLTVAQTDAVCLTHR